MLRIKLNVILILCLLSGYFQINAQDVNYVKFEEQEITINDFNADGLILDIGGGGEGVIGQLKGNQVVSIDLYEDELVNAPSTNLKIVMDARDMKFIDNSFNTVVIFYTLMYIKGKDHEKVFKEVKRVLNYGGKLIIWDVNLPIAKDTIKPYARYSFKFKLPNKEINTGYGVPFAKGENYDMDYYINLAKNEGFNVLKKSNNGLSFYLELQRTPLFPTPLISDTLQQIIDKSGIQTALQTYQQLKQSRPNDFIFSAKALEKLCGNLYFNGKIKESVDILKLCIQEYDCKEERISEYANLYLNENQYDGAIELNKLNVERNPQSADAYQNLAEAYMKAGNKKLATENFKKSLQLNPQNKKAQEKLDELKRKK